jgi:hypothetical protein
VEVGAIWVVGGSDRGVIDVNPTVVGEVGADEGARVVGLVTGRVKGAVDGVVPGIWGLAVEEMSGGVVSGTSVVRRHMDVSFS